MAVLFAVLDPVGHRIVCHGGTWANHIVIEHPEVVGREADVRRTIEQPDRIFQSAQHTRRKVFHRSTHFGRPIGRADMRVIVEYNARQSAGTVITAFAAAGPKRGEVLIWPPSP